MSTPTHAPQGNFVVEYLELERQRFTEQCRLVYIVAGCIGVALLLLNTYSSFQVKTSYTGIAVINNLVFALVVIVFVLAGAARWISLGVLERALFGFLALQSLVFNSLFPWFFGLDLQKVLFETTSDDVWLLVIVCALALHLFERRLGLFLGFGLYGLSLAITATYVIQRLARDDGRGLVGDIAQSYFLGLILLFFIFMLSYYRDNAQRISLRYQMLEQVAFVDALTGLPNRRRMYETLQNQISLAERYGMPFVVVLMDLDHFKRINDRFGHLVGDQVLVRVAEVARQQLRAPDCLGRWGGEEFLLVLPQIGLEEAMAVATRICEAIASIRDLTGGGITLSCGLTLYQGGNDTDHLIQRADTALYDAKNAGRNQVKAA